MQFHFNILFLMTLIGFNHEVITKNKESDELSIHTQHHHKLSYRQEQRINPILKSKYCHQGQHSRIIGGNIANEISFLYAAAIYFCGQRKIAVSIDDCYLICGGSIISRHHILTAAHCMFNIGNVPKKRQHHEMLVRTIISRHHILTAAHCMFNIGNVPKKRQHHEMLVRIGNHDLRTPEVIYGKHRTTFQIKHITTHGNFNITDPFLLNDLAIIRLRHAMVFTEFIQPVCIDGLHLKYGLKEQSSVAIAGWGNIAQDGPISDVLKYTKLDVSLCSDFQYSASEMQFCAIADSEINGYVCNGDSGSGLLPLDDNNDDSVNVIVGILSGSGYFTPDGVAMCDDPMYFVNVTTYAQWINEHLT